MLIGNYFFVWYFSRLAYFGGYGHKLLSDLDRRRGSFIVDETSWVGFLLLTTSLLAVSVRFFWRFLLEKLASLHLLSSFVIARWEMSFGDGTMKFTYLTPCSPAGVNRGPTWVSLRLIHAGIDWSQEFHVWDFSPDAIKL